MVCYHVNTMKTTFGFNFDLYYAVKQIDTQNFYKHSSKEKLSIKKLLFNFVIQKNLVNNQNKSCHHSMC